tara:strand:- start:1008 stop:1361 length:354 start_codon:yes stop_codon:yes gene_type:complete
MAYKRAMTYVTTMACGVTSTSEVDLEQAFDQILVGIPTMTSGCDVLIKVAGFSGDTYRNLYHEPKVDSTTPTKVQINSSVTQAYVPFRVGGCQFVKVELSTAMTATAVEFDIVGLSF